MLVRTFFLTGKMRNRPLVSSAHMGRRWLARLGVAFGHVALAEAGRASALLADSELDALLGTLAAAVVLLCACVLCCACRLRRRGADGFSIKPDEMLLSEHAHGDDAHAVKGMHVHQEAHDGEHGDGIPDVVIISDAGEVTAREHCESRWMLARCWKGRYKPGV
jgi:hypothetical protein